MSLMVEPLNSRGRLLSAIGVPIRLPRVPQVRPSRAWPRALKRRLAPLVLFLCDFVEMTIEAAGFGLLFILFMFCIYVLG